MRPFFALGIRRSAGYGNFEMSGGVIGLGSNECRCFCFDGSGEWMRKFVVIGNVNFEGRKLVTFF